MSSEALSRQAGDMPAEGPSAERAPAHTQPRHVVPGDWLALAQQLPFIALCGNSVIDVIIQAPRRDIFCCFYPSSERDR